MIIAKRTLSISGDPRATEIAVRIFAPEEQDDGAWLCRYEIDWPEGSHGMTMGGFDSVQALYIAMSMIGSEIYASSYHQLGQLSFGEAGKGYYFPVPKNIRDLLVGDDAVYL